MISPLKSVRKFSLKKKKKKDNSIVLSHHLIAYQLFFYSRIFFVCPCGFLVYMLRVSYTLVSCFVNKVAIVKQQGRTFDRKRFPTLVLLSVVAFHYFWFHSLYSACAVWKPKEHECFSENYG